jgi:hypothetical protein
LQGWAANVWSMASGAQGLPCYLVEWFRPELSEEELNRIAAKLDESAQSMQAEGSPVQRVMLLVVPGDEVVFGVFTASSAAVVARACERAGVIAERLTAGVAERVASA